MHIFIFVKLHYSKDVRLPLQLQRAMAAEAEASREARAKVSTNSHLPKCIPPHTPYVMYKWLKNMILAT